jgi:hypothetical protein
MVANWLHSKSRLTMASLSALAMMAVAAGPADAEGSLRLTNRQRAEVMRALMQQGLPLDQAARIAADNDSALQVATSVESTTEVGTPVRIKGLPGRVGAALGTCNAGDYSNHYTVTVYGISPVGIRTFWTKLTTNWCYNKSRVTYAAYTKTAGVYSGTSSLVWFFDHWGESTQYFYTSGGHTNGAVLTQVQANFRLCIAYKFGCIQSANPWIQARVYWNGTAINYVGQ